MAVRVSVCVRTSASPVQVVSLHVVVLEHPEKLHVLADEAGRQQAVGPQLETLLQGESHALRTHTNPLHYIPPCPHIQQRPEWATTIGR